MKYYLKYYAYKYLNNQHSRFERAFFNLSAKILLVLLFAPRSVFAVVAKEVSDDDLKLVVRRLIWLLRYSSLRISLIKDRYFDMSIGLTTDASLDLYNRMSDYNHWESDFEKHICLAQFASAVMESQVCPGDAFLVADLSYSEFDNKFISHISRARTMVAKAEHVDGRETPARSRVPVGRDLKVNLMQRYALDVFRDMLELSKDLDVELFAIGGTLLGLIRDKNFIAHDYDIDLGISYDQLNDEFITRLSKLEGYKPLKSDFPCYRDESKDGVTYIRDEKPSLLKLFHRSGTQVDIFVHFEDEKSCWHGSSLHRWENTKFDLVNKDFLGMQVLTPENFDLYLTEHYGDWRTPVREFNCSTGTPNVVISNSCKTKCFFLKKAYYDYG